MCHLLWRCDRPCAKETGSGGVEVNLTLHIDWTFLLISTQKRSRTRENNRTQISVLGARYRNGTVWYKLALMGDLYIWLTAVPNMIVFFTNLMHRFFILMHLLHFSTCFEHYYAHLQEDNCISTVSGIVTVFRWLFSTEVTKSPPVTCVLNSHLKTVTIPDTVLIQFVLLKMSIILLETCRRI